MVVGKQNNSRAGAKPHVARLKTDLFPDTLEFLRNYQEVYMGQTLVLMSTARALYRYSYGWKLKFHHLQISEIS